MTTPDPQQPYQQPFHPGPPPLATGGAPARTGLFDLKFTRFLSLTLISVWWIVALAVIAAAAVVGVITGLTKIGGSPGAAVLYIVGSLVGAVVLAVLTRLFLESIAVLFRIADNTSEMARRH